ncbi:MAG: EamA family transporter [Polynucleobacter sp. 24-46-87]|jgi:drug/metabolite transporter (DMT)-like permease|uniref:DMT family transporter n=1 Tax=unclassified Polynucleobacter TaxID=2640945 RepID=UPI000BCBC9AD|nr:MULTISPECIES: DMT family transporter [unclassified Polynucleobacter]OYY20593.1 MAG: EamA family transporter [Polynucleobacter sp. 35-46-11]OZA16379.1 MAG: EamA family transporter [Polynucleobacter sp. 24-46-87]OZA77936.1 MAG: EamA family transporter [Polynucleobacter sp. 39-46-10]
MQSASGILHHRRYIYGLLMAGLGSVLFSGKAILIKLAFGYGANAETLIALRMLMALPLFWGIYWWQARRQVMSPLTWQDQIKVFVLGFMGYFLSSYLDFLGLQYISVGLERIVLYLTPTIVLLISYFVLNKPISRLQWYALVVGYLGVIVVFIQDANSTGSMAILGMLLIFASACSYAIYMIGSGEMVKRVGSVRMVVYASSASALMSVIQILIYDPRAVFTQVQQIYWLSLLNASLCTVIPMLLIMIAINRIGSPLVAQAGILGPVSTLFMGWIVLSEPITWIQLSGMSLVIGAMWLLVRNDAPRKQKGPNSTKSLDLEGSDPLN